jgi:hypothetical protein
MHQSEVYPHRFTAPATIARFFQRFPAKAAEKSKAKFGDLANTA